MDKTTLKIPIAGQGTVEMEIPERWRSEIADMPPNSPQIVQLVPDDNSVVHFSFFWNISGTQGFGTRTFLETSVERLSEKAKLTSIESGLIIHELTGDSVDALFFSATDSVVTPSGYKYLTQGVGRVDRFVFNFTILTRHEESPVVSCALRIIENINCDSQKQEIDTFKGIDKSHGWRVNAKDGPSRVDCVRAGWVFPFYWQNMYSGNVPVMSSADKDSIVSSLGKVFTNPDYDLDAAAAAYSSDQGSNEVLLKAMQRVPDYAFRWFRVGQSVILFLDKLKKDDNVSMDMDSRALSMAFGAASVSREDTKKLLKELGSHRTTASSEEILDSVSSVYTEIQRLASLQDRSYEFEKDAINEGEVFISYSHQDKEAVKEITFRFDWDEIIYWIDNKRIRAGELFGEKIDDGIGQCRVFLISLSPSSVSSEYVLRELEMALKREAEGEMFVLPVLVKKMSRSEIPEVLQKKVFVDLTTELEKGYAEIKKSIVANLKEFAARNS